MKLDFYPAHIALFKEFPLEKGEVLLEMTNTVNHPVFVFRRLLVCDSDRIPVAEALLCPESDTDENEKEFMEIPVDTTNKPLTATLVMSRESLSQLVSSEEYHFLAQVEEEPVFPWMSAVLDNMAAFRDGESLQRVVEKATRIRPLEFLRIPFVTQELLQEDSLHLCMDFGTSFSACALAAGASMAEKLACYREKGDHESIWYTHFQDIEKKPTPMLPTTMLLVECTDNGPRWLFGYEANEMAKKVGGKATYFTGIKRFLTSMDETEKCHDCNGKVKDFTREEIVRAYIEYLVESGKKYFGVDFKSIHVSTPVQCQDRQREALEYILKGLGFAEVNTRLDEARAPLYYFLSSRVEKASRKESQESRLDGKSLGYLIIDCGGGSMDATLLRGISLTPPKRTGGAITMHSEEPVLGGNNEFGGENLTNYLFSYIKMKIYDLYKDMRERESGKIEEKATEYLIDSLIGIEIDDIFYNLNKEERKISESGDAAYQEQKRKEIVPSQLKLAYGRFDEFAEEVEFALPTREEEYRDKSREAWQKVNHNKTFLRQLAESLKRSCYADGAPKIIDLTELPEWRNFEPEVFIRAGNSFRNIVSIIKKGDLVFSGYEIDKLFRPVIFAEISRIIRQLNVEDELLDDKNSMLYVRFVGQSTRIPIFTQALAYFLPQRIIEEEEREYTGERESLSRFLKLSQDQKKLCCVAGAAKFQHHIATGKIREDSFVANKRVRKDICRLDENGLLYNEAPLVLKDTLFTEARGAFLRSRSSVMIEHFGTSYDEQIRREGWITFKDSELRRAVPEAEIRELSAKWGGLVRDLAASVEEGDPLVLIVLEISENKMSQKYAFYPYAWDPEEKNYISTEEPLEMQFRE